jgi:hypothetical protein
MQRAFDVNDEMQVRSTGRRRRAAQRFGGERVHGAGSARSNAPLQDAVRVHAGASDEGLPARVEQS